MKGTAANSPIIKIPNIPINKNKITKYAHFHNSNLVFNLIYSSPHSFVARLREPLGQGDVLLHRPDHVAGDPGSCKLTLLSAISLALLPAAIPSSALLSLAGWIRLPYRAFARSGVAIALSKHASLYFHIFFTGCISHLLSTNTRFWATVSSISHSSTLHPVPIPLFRIPNIFFPIFNERLDIHSRRWISGHPKSSNPTSTQEKNLKYDGKKF
ncbi:hypothetical protein [Cupriavidus basilensis]